MMTDTTIKKAYVDIPSGKQIHYRYAIPTANARSTPIIYLHKSASSSASFELLMSHYAAQGYAGYAPDMPGSGQSFDPTEEDAEAIHEQGTKWFTDIFLAAFDKLGVRNGASSWAPPRKFHIIGHHSGASLASQIAATHPEMVASICSIGATIIGYEERQEMKERFLKPFSMWPESRCGFERSANIFAPLSRQASIRWISPPQDVGVSRQDGRG